MFCFLKNRVFPLYFVIPALLLLSGNALGHSCASLADWLFASNSPESKQYTWKNITVTEVYSHNGNLKEIHLIDPTDSRFFASAWLNHSVLSIAIRTKEGTARSSKLKGFSALEYMFPKFRGNIKSISSVWNYGDNLEKVNQLTTQDTTLNDAIAQTWSANAFRALNFNEFEVVSFQGQDGSYSSIKVRFY